MTVNTGHPAKHWIEGILIKLTLRDWVKKIDRTIWPEGAVLRRVGSKFKNFALMATEAIHIKFEWGGRQIKLRLEIFQNLKYIPGEEAILNRGKMQTKDSGFVWGTKIMVERRYAVVREMTLYWFKWLQVFLGTNRDTRRAVVD